MEILIQGSKDGYRVLHKTLNFPSNFAEDSRIEDVENNRSTIGKNTYSISISNNGTIFSKSVGSWDLKRRAIGTINFSVFIPNNKKLKSEDLKSLLDELSNKYSYNYIKDGNLSFEVPEDWSQFIAIAKEYENKLITLVNDDYENYQQGVRNAAFIYYSNNEELLKYFEHPFQDEYNSYKQVYLIDQKFEGKSENPLNALRHDSNANLTGKISLDNPKYKLLFNQIAKGGINIEIRVNGSLRVNKSKVKRNDLLEITWSKQFRESITEKGKCFELSNYIDINENEKTITIRENLELKQKSYIFDLEILDQTSNPIKDATIHSQIGDGPLKNQKDYKLVLASEDLQQTCFLYAQKEALYSIRKVLISENSLTPIKLKLQAERNITISVMNESGLQLQNWTIQNALTDRNTGLKNTPSNGVIKLVGDEITKKWTLAITHSDYSYVKPIKDIEFTDENYKTLHLNNEGLIKIHQNTAKKYRIKIDTKKGVDSKNQNNYLTDNIPENIIESKHGYHFLKWDIKPNPSNNNENICEAIFEEHWYKNLVWYVLFFVLIGSIIIGYQYWKSEPITLPELTETDYKIREYVEGIELNLETLEKFKTDNCLQNTISSETCEKLENAIKLRNAIKQGDIDQLKTLDYSNEQNTFKNVIDSISMLSNNKKTPIINKLKSFSKNNMNLNIIAEELRGKNNSIDAEHTSGANQTGRTNQTDETNQTRKANQAGDINQTSGTNQSGGSNNPDEIRSFINEFKELNSDNDTSQNDYVKLKNKYSKITNKTMTYLKSICNKTKNDFKNFRESDADEKDKPLN